MIQGKLIKTKSWQITYLNLFLDRNKIGILQEVVLLGLTIDVKLNFKPNIKYICHKIKNKNYTCYNT